MEARLSNYCTDSRFKRRRMANYCRKIWAKDEKAYCNYASDKPKYQLAVKEICGEIEAAAPAASPAADQEKKGPQAADPDLETWNMVKNSNDISSVKMYLESFPQGKFRVAAKILLNKLQKSESSPADGGTVSAPDVQFKGTAPGGVATSGSPGSIERVTPVVTGNTASQKAAIFLDSRPSGAEVFLGDIKAGTTPYQNLSLKAGQEVMITLKKKDYHDKRIVLELSGGVNELETIALQPSVGDIEINSEPSGATVILAGEEMGTTPLKISKYSSGNYLLSLKRQFYFPLENQRIRVADGKTTQLNYTLSPNFGILDVETDPEEVQLSIYDEEGTLVEQTRTPQEIKLKPGNYKLHFSREGYLDLEFKATVALKDTMTIDADDAKLVRKQGYLIVSSDPLKKGAAVLVNGEEMGKIPANLTLPVGEHTIAVKTDELEGETQVEIEHGDSEAVTIQLALSAEIRAERERKEEEEREKRRIERIKNSVDYKNCMDDSFWSGVALGAEMSKGGAFYISTLVNTLMASSPLPSQSSTTTQERNKCKKKFGITASEYRQIRFLAVNHDKLMLEMSGTDDEHLTAMSHLMGCPAEQSQRFVGTCRKSFSDVFSSPGTHPAASLLSLKEALYKDPVLARNCRAIY